MNPEDYRLSIVVEWILGHECLYSRVFPSHDAALRYCFHRNWREMRKGQSCRLQIAIRGGHRR